jgi:hypothetical protein
MEANFDVVVLNLVGRISAAIARGTGFSLSKYVYRCRRARGLLRANAPLHDQSAAI